jgi:Flp pilus assembly protein TadG
MCPRWREATGGERGSATLEFAMVLPLLLIVTLALVQVGLVVRDRLVLADAARAGAREAAVTDDPGRIRDAVERAAAAALDTGRLEVRVERAGGRGTAVTVTVGYPDGTSIPAVAWLFPATIHLEAATTMRQEFGDG